MSQLPDAVLTRIVRQSRCAVCDGNGFRRVKPEGPDDPGYAQCRECDGRGIHLGVCRRLAREHAEKP